ncbi:MAG: sulfatase-like hydrolase/transferase [Verrucomicrobiae bacterium]|nr:sulfatase-like hydrolase/transferase [Verrucomicrobiae bacterium]
MRLPSAPTVAAPIALAICLAHAAPQSPGAPNVILVITDDQGYGELSCHGNPVLKTPNLDRLHAESLRFTDFHVAPMCTPTRGQLMTGADALRNGAMNVSSGRAILRREFPTMPEIFGASAYRTGIFGKWHLGDTQPYRPQDRGFHESLWFPSSHIGSVPDAWENDYFDDTYLHNGRRQGFEGYTTDVLFREAIAWMKAESEAGRPFFCYIATAAPHWPHFVPERFRPPIRDALDAAKATLPPMPPAQRSELVSYLAMIASIDENVGALDRFLRDSGLRDNTLLIFLTDNGSTFGPRYFNAGMKGGKVTLWEGGHRVPCFFRWPNGDLGQPRDVTGLAQAQDILPTLIDLCALQRPPAARFDGISLAPALRGHAPLPENRMLVINYSRMPHGMNHFAPDSPAVPRREGAAVLWKRWRLLEDRELYDLETDPLQERNVIAQHPDVAAAMRRHLDHWWDGVRQRINEFQPIAIGHATENPTLLTACEWADVFVDQQAQVRRGERKNGFWHIDVTRDGPYTFELRRWPRGSSLNLNDPIPETPVADGALPAGPAFAVARGRLRIGAFDQTRSPAPEADCVRFSANLPAGRTSLQTWFYDAGGAEIAGAYYVYVEKDPTAVIFDTDIMGDVDDVGAVATLHALASRGELRILAMAVCAKHPACAPCLDALNTHFGRPDIPIGVNKGPGRLRDTRYADKIAAEFPHDLASADAAPDATALYRKTLASQPDGSVVLVTIGQLSNVSALLRSQPDAHSPLPGPELAKMKIRLWVCMGGQFPGGREANFYNHPDAAQHAIAAWPGPIVLSGFEIGVDILTGGKLTALPATDPVRRAYDLYNGLKPHKSWDQTAVLFAARGPGDLWSLERGLCTVLPDGSNQWVPSPDGPHARLIPKAPPQEAAAAIEALMLHKQPVAP